jgi:hypothetical protein
VEFASTDQQTAAAAAAAAVLQVGDKIKYIKVLDGLQNMVNL